MMIGNSAALRGAMRGRDRPRSLLFSERRRNISACRGVLRIGLTCRNTAPALGVTPKSRAWRPSERASAAYRQPPSYSQRASQVSWTMTRVSSGKVGLMRCQSQ